MTAVRGLLVLVLVLVLHMNITAYRHPYIVLLLLSPVTFGIILNETRPLRPCLQLNIAVYHTSNVTPT